MRWDGADWEIQGNCAVACVTAKEWVSARRDEHRSEANRCRSLGFEGRCPGPALALVADLLPAKSAVGAKAQRSALARNLRRRRLQGLHAGGARAEFARHRQARQSVAVDRDERGRVDRRGRCLPRRHLAAPFQSLAAAPHLRLRHLRRLRVGAAACRARCRLGAQRLVPQRCRGGGRNLRPPRPRGRRSKRHFPGFRLQERSIERLVRACRCRCVRFLLQFASLSPRARHARGALRRQRLSPNPDARR